MARLVNMMNLYAAATLRTLYRTEVPSLIPAKAGDQLKTDKKDTIKLVRLLRAGEITAVHEPDEGDDAIHALCRTKNYHYGLLRRLVRAETEQP